MECNSAQFVKLHDHGTELITFNLSEMTSGDEFSSATSQYKKIVKGANNYTYYVSKCTG